jgi:hypothetical protein
MPFIYPVLVEPFCKNSSWERIGRESMKRKFHASHADLEARYKWLGSIGFSSWEDISPMSDI